MWRTGPEPCLCNCGASFTYEVDGEATPSNLDELEGTCPDTGERFVMTGIRAWMNAEGLAMGRVLKVHYRKKSGSF